MLKNINQRIKNLLYPMRELHILGKNDFNPVINFFDKIEFIDTDVLDHIYDKQWQEWLFSNKNRIILTLREDNKQLYWKYLEYGFSINEIESDYHDSNLYTLPVHSCTLYDGKLYFGSIQHISEISEINFITDKLDEKLSTLYSILYNVTLRNKSLLELKFPELKLIKVYSQYNMIPYDLAYNYVFSKYLFLGDDGYYFSNRKTKIKRSMIWL